MADGLIAQQNQQQEGKVEEFSPERPEAPEVSKYQGIVADVKREQETAFRRSFSTALETDPDLAVQVDRLSRRTGLPRVAVENDIGRVQRESRAQEIQAMVERSPVLARQMQDADFASISHDDVEQLSRLEQLLSLQPQEQEAEQVGLLGGTLESFQRGRQDRRLAELSFAALTGQITPSQIEERDRLSQELANQQALQTDNPFGQFLFDAGRQAPILGSVALQAGERGAQAGLVVGGSTLLVPGAQPAAPFTAVGAFSAGAATGAIEQSFILESGFAYEEYRNFIDETGRPLDDDVARGAAILTGAINSGLELTGFKYLLRGIPGLRNLNQLTGRQFVNQLLKRPTFRDALKRFATTYAGTVTVETATEGIQELVTSLVGEGAKLASEQQFEGVATLSEIFGRSAEAGATAFRATTILGLPGPTASLAVDARRAQQAEQNVRVIEGLNEAAGNSRTRERVPERFRRFVEEATADGPVETMYVDVDRWDELFQSENIDPQEAAAEVFGDNGAAYREARSEGGDLQIPTARYAEKLAGTEYADRIAQDVRLSVDGMSAREASQFQAEMESMVQDVQTTEPEAFVQIRDDIAGQLVNAGVPQDSADVQARLTAAFITTQAQYENIDPVELYESRSQRISRPLPEVLTTRGGEIDTDLDPLIDRIRAGDIPSETDVYGEGLLDFLRQYGLVPDSELEARDVDQRLAPFQRRLVRDDAELTLDDAALYAWEEGFIESEAGPDQRPTPDDLLRAIDAELGGGTVFRRTRLDTPQATERQLLLELEQFFAEMGVDLNEISNQEARQMLEDAAVQEGDVQLDQAPVVDQEAPSVIFEVAPDPNNVDLTERWNQLSVNERLDVSRRVANQVIPGVLEASGAQGRVTEQIGSYLEETNPSFAVRLEAGDPMQVARGIGFALSQDSMMVVAPNQFEGSFEAGAVQIVVGEQTEQQIDDLYQQIRGIEGIPQVQGQTTVDGQMTILLEEGVNEEAVAQAIDNALGNQFEVRTTTVNAAFPENTEYNYASQADDPAGTEGVARQRYRDARAEATSLLEREVGDVRLEQPGAVRGRGIQRLREGDLGDVPEYGEARDGSTRVVGVHYSREPRESLSGQFYGTGMRGAEARRLRGADERLQSRVHFYIDEGAGVQPEGGVGRNVHAVALNNIYDLRQDPLGIARQVEAVSTEFNDVELALIDAGFDGYFVSQAQYMPGGDQQQQGVAVLIGPQHDQVPVSIVQRPETLFQEGADQARGSIRFQRTGDRRVFNITLFDKANLSTYLHESGHYFLELLGDLVERDGASDRLQQDWQRILNFLEVDSREQIGTAQHEKWARAFEAYLREGKAPSVELETAFAKFRAWLVAIYRQLRALDVEITDEVRGVMDRMLATDEQIQAAQESQNYQPIFDSAEQAGMTPEEFTEYQRTVEMARAEAENDLSVRMMREMERETKAWWKERREEVRAEVEQDVYSQAPYRAMFFLQKGRMPFGEQPIDAFKLDRDVLVERYGKEFLKRLPGPKSESNRGAYVYTRENGVHPDTAATMLGFSSADEMVKSMINARDARELIEADTDVRMREQFGDMLTDGSLPEAAMEAVHNNARAKLLSRELQILNRRRGNRGRGAVEQIKASAQRAIRQKRIVDIRPDSYRRAEAKAARASFQAALDQNFDLAFTEKQRQIYNHYLFREARNAREQAEKDRRRIVQFAKKGRREVLGKAGDDYLQQVDQILADHQFSPISNRQVQERIELRDWLADKADQFSPIQEPEYVAPDEGQKAANQAALEADPRNPQLESLASEVARIAWKEMTPEELSGVRQNIDLIYHLAKLKTELIEKGEKRTLEQAAEEVVSSINENANRRIVADLQPERALSRTRRGRDEFFTKSRRVPSFAREMDGGEDAGAVWRNIIQPINRATNNYNDRLQQHGQRFEQLFNDHYSSQEQANFLKDPIYYESIDASLTKDAVLAIALNWGNETNRKRLMDGEGWSQAQIEAVLDTLEKRDWDFVQASWDYLEEYWPEFRENHRALYGIPPEKVAPAPVATRFGEYRGGYYPIKFDSTRSTRANVQQIQEQGQRYQSPANRARAGASQSRVRGQVRMPLRLSVASVMNQHVNEVIKHIEFDRPLLDVGRLVTRDDVRDAMVSNYGQAVYDRFYRMLVDVRWGVRPAENVFESFLDHTRNGASVAYMGLKATTALLQPLGISNSIVVLGGNQGAGKGAYWVLRGLARIGRSAVSLENAAKFAMTNSSFMRARRQNINREVSNVLAQVKGGSLRQKIASGAFWPIVNMQFAIVDLPTWYGAYEKALSAGLDKKTALEVADQTVRDAQGGGDLVDQTEFQRGNAYTRSFTNFISYMATTYSIQAERYRSYNLRSFADYVRLISDHMLLAVFPAVGNLLIQSMRDSEDDEEDLGAKMAFEYVGMATGAFIGVRELTGALEGFSYRGPAGQSGLSEMSRLVTQAGQVVFAGDIDESIEQLDQSLARSALRTTGVLFHLPAAQVDATFFGTKALLDGETDNPMSVIFGPPQQ